MSDKFHCAIFAEFNPYSQCRHLPDIFPPRSRCTAAYSFSSQLLLAHGRIPSLKTPSSRLNHWFFGTEIGSAIRATGNNANMVRANGISTNVTIILALMLSNALNAFSGALVAQQQGYSDVKMGIGAIVMALASIVLGEVLFGRKGGFARRLISIVIGSICYRIIVAVVLQLGLNADNLKLFTAILVGVALSIPIMMESSKQKKMYKKLTAEVDAIEEPFHARD